MDPTVLKHVLALPDHAGSARLGPRDFSSPMWERCGTARGGVLGGQRPRVTPECTPFADPAPSADLHAAGLQRHQLRAPERIDEPHAIDGDHLLVLLRF
jgi:hypothetical protein